MSIKHERIENQIRKEVSHILQTEIKNSNFGFVTVTDVILTRDYSLATIYVTFLNTKAIMAQDRLVEIERVKGVVRSLLAKRLTIRKTPELIFKLDTSYDQGQKIDDIIASIKQEDK